MDADKKLEGAEERFEREVDASLRNAKRMADMFNEALTCFAPTKAVETPVTPEPDYRTVTIPACDEHEGIYAATVTLLWLCPVCGGPRGETFSTLSYDGSRRLGVDGWKNPCGHVDKYPAVRAEAYREVTA